MPIVEYLEKQSKPLLIIIGFLLIASVGYIDYLTGPELSLLFVYLIPTSFVIWFVGKRSGILVAILSALLWFIEDIAPRIQFFNSVSTYGAIAIDIVSFFIFSYLLVLLKDIVSLNKELERTDTLTGVVNRKAFYDLAAIELHRSARYKHHFTVAYMDIDNFRVVNYRFGHHSGDLLLRAVAQTIRGNLRDVDLIARFGGDEFTVLLPETSAEQAQIVLSRLRNRLLDTMERNEWPVTFSFGAVTFINPPASVEEMMKKVGSVMYAAKDNGMNTIEQEVASV